MYLSHIQIKNFRNFEKLSVDLFPGLNVLVGENNVGKTNLFDAIRIALGGQSNQGDSVRITKDDLYKDKTGEVFSNSFSISLTFAELDEKQRGEFLDILEFNASEPSLSIASLHFQWTWSDVTNRGTSRRWGGKRTNSEYVGEEVLQAIQVTMLIALRDALKGLQPGRNSQLGRLIRALATKEQESALETIVGDANEKLESNELIESVTSTIQSSLSGATGSVLTQKISINTSAAEFREISNNLRIAIKRLQVAPEIKAKLEELWDNGLGYNNLLYIATVLSELEATKDASLALLLVEEPEAHLHPQLQTILADFLSQRHTSAEGNVQTLVTTHSPTIASRVDPNSITVLHRSAEELINATSFRNCGLSSSETKQLQRMLDVTKATMLFARGVVLVEGISEMLLLPVLAKRLELLLEESSIALVPICGVDFDTFGKLFGKDRIAVRLAIITDGDPKQLYEEVVGSENSEPTSSAGAISEENDDADDLEPVDKNWDRIVPHFENGAYVSCKRTKELIERYKGNDYVGVFSSNVTLEFDLADSGKKNVEVMCRAWTNCFKGTPRTFNQRILEECGDDHNKRVLSAWRGICIAKPKAGKAEFSQELASLLDEKSDNKYKVTTEDFVVPGYLSRALQFVTQKK